MRCHWCYAKEKIDSSSSMTLDVLESILSVVANKPINVFTLIGGEPTIHKDLSSFIKRLKPSRVMMVSNGLRLANMSYLFNLKESGLDVVALSLKGANQAEYLKNTGVPGLDKVERAVANMNALGMQYNISVTFSDSVMDSLPMILDWMQSSNAQSMSINYCRPYVVDGRISAQGVPSPVEMAERTVQSYELIRKSGVRCTFSFLLPLCLLPREFIDLLVSRNELSTICQLQKHTGIIFEPDGSLIPCHHLFDYKLGKLGEDFTTAAEFDTFMEGGKISRFYRKTGGFPHEKCLSCDLRTRCGGGCLVQHLQYSPSELIPQAFERMEK
ncbi:radical SAM protein [Patescibacteria group bacterium]|nr:radical SAM protein [Patescibacteria group bacterium]